MPDSVDEGKLFFREWVSIFSPKRVLDVGTGVGTYGKMIKALDPSCYVEGVEVHQPYIDQFNLRSIYDAVHCQDVIDFSKGLNITNYDLIVFGDVLEHLTKEDAIDVWKRLKQRAKFLWISLPIRLVDRLWSHGYHQPPYEYQTVLSERHQYNWEHGELIRELGPFIWQAPFRIVGVFGAEGEIKA